MKQTNKHTTQSNQTKHIESINEATSVQIASGAVASSGETAMEKPKGFLRGLFDDLSMAQVIAGALAAATVFLLSSVIGVAGSLIGAAIGSVISAVSSQIYKKALSVSADKIRDAGSTSLLNGLGEDSASSSSSSMNSDAVQGLHTHGSGDGQGAQAMGTNNSSNDEATTQLRSDEATTQLCSEDGLNAATRVMNANDIRYTAPNAQEVDPALRRAHERRNRKAKVQRQVLVVSVVSSLIAIAICAGVITFATQGEGIGTKTDPILPAITNSQSYSSQEEGTSSHHNQSTANDSSASEGANTSSNSSSGSTNTSGEQSGQSGTSSDQNSSQGTGSTSGQGSTDDSGSRTNDGSSSGGTNGGSSSDSNAGSGSSSGTGTGSGTGSNASSNTGTSSGA